MSAVRPGAARKRRMPGRQRPRRAFAMHPHPAEIVVKLALHEIVADLIDQREIGCEDLTKCQGDRSKITKRLMIAKFPPAATALR